MTRDGVCHGKNKQNFKFDIMYSYINQLYIEGLFSQSFYTVAKFSQKILYMHNLITGSTPPHCG